MGQGPLQSLILDWAKVAWGGGFGFTWGYFGAQAQLNSFGWSWNFTCHVLDNFTWDFVLFFQAHLLEVSVVKIVKVQWCQKNLNCSSMIFISKEIWKGIFFFERSAHLFCFFPKRICALKTPLLTKEFFIFLYLTFERSTHLWLFSKNKLCPRIKNPL